MVMVLNPLRALGWVTKVIRIAQSFDMSNVWAAEGNRSRSSPWGITLRKGFLLLFSPNIYFSTWEKRRCCSCLSKEWMHEWLEGSGNSLWTLEGLSHKRGSQYPTRMGSWGIFGILNLLYLWAHPRTYPWKSIPRAPIISNLHAL